MSTITNAVVVAGSIGGLASSVGNLAALAGAQTGTWRDKLKTAMYGNVPLGVESVSTSAGRNTSVHRYPFRQSNPVWVEDIGIKPRQFEVLGFLVENDIKTGGGSVIAQRDALLTVCETAGPQTLVHPTLGEIKNVCCLAVDLTERRDLGLAFEVRLTLIVSGDRLFPTATASSGDDSRLKADQTFTAALADFVADTASAIQAGAAVVQQAVSTAVLWYQIATTAINDVKRIVGAVSTLSGNFGRLFGGANNGFAGANVQASPNTTADDLLSAATAARSVVQAAGAALQIAAANPSDSTDLGAAVQTLIASVAAAATDPADAVRLVQSLAQYSPAPVTTPGQIGASMLAMQIGMAALFRRYALAQLAVTLTTYQPSSQDDANTVLGNAISLFDSEITTAGDAGDDDSYQALRALKQSMVADLVTRGADLASIATFTFQAALPSMVLANRIYRDPTRADQLVQQANPRHPAFMPTSFQALSS